MQLEILKSLGGFYDGLASPPSGVFRLHISSLFLPYHVPCTPRWYRHIHVGYTINIPCFYHSLILVPFVAGNIKYFKIGGWVAPGGGNILNIFLPYFHLLVTRQIAQNIVNIRSKWPEISPV